MILKIASPSEYEPLKKLFYEIYQSVDNKAQFNWPLVSIESELLLSQFLICIDEQNHICGFIGYRDNQDFYEIMALGVSTSARRKNVMTSLLLNLQAVGRKELKILLLEVHIKNKAAIELYKKVGFMQVGTRKSYYADGSDALTFQYI